MRLLSFVRGSRRRRLETAAEKARRLHSAWLTHALNDPSALPRIPVRPVSRGGFAAIVASPGGRAWADRWWSGAFHQVEGRR